MKTKEGRMAQSFRDVVI